MTDAQKQLVRRLNFYVKLLLFVALLANGHSPVMSQDTANTNKEIGSSVPVAPKSPTKEVIAPEKFSGEIAAGYKAAQKTKNICSKLFCYCGCDLTDEHVSLLDCFTSMHGVDCAICQEEAIIALHMKEQGKSLGLIQKTIDEKFSAQYPWDEPSPALQQYLTTIQVYQNISKSNLPLKQSHTKYNTAVNNGQRKKKQGHCCGH